MEYAIQLLIPLMLGLWMGQGLSGWLGAHGLGRYDWLAVLGCLLGFAMGMAMMYRRLVLDGKQSQVLGKHTEADEAKAKADPHVE